MCAQKYKYETGINYEEIRKTDKCGISVYFYVCMYGISYRSNDTTFWKVWLGHRRITPAVLQS